MTWLEREADKIMDAREREAAHKAQPKHLPFCFTELGGSCNCGSAQRIPQECNGSGGFGPPKDSGLLGWHACNGCPKCKPETARFFG